MDNLFSETLDWLGFTCVWLSMIDGRYLIIVALCQMFSFAVRWRNTQRIKEYIKGMKEIKNR